jgi:undecaprenyl-diphosphatase
LFLFLNGIHTPFFDVVFEWISERFSWMPLYAILAVLMGFKFKWRFLIIIPFALLLIIASDQISVHLFKDVFMRLRPCHNPIIADLVHVVNGHCGGQYGFVSSHAANTFALACFVGLVLKNHFKWMLPFMLCLGSNSLLQQNLFRGSLSWRYFRRSSFGRFNWFFDL